jgi:hypothetical protein
VGGVYKTLSQSLKKKLGMGYVGSINRITVQAGLGINMRPYSKNT